MGGCTGCMAVALASRMGRMLRVGCTGGGGAPVSHMGDGAGAAGCRRDNLFEQGMQ